MLYDEFANTGTLIGAGFGDAPEKVMLHFWTSEHGMLNTVLYDIDTHDVQTSNSAANGHLLAGLYALGDNTKTLKEKYRLIVTGILTTFLDLAGTIGKQIQYGRRYAVNIANEVAKADYFASGGDDGEDRDVIDSINPGSFVNIYYQVVFKLIQSLSQSPVYAVGGKSYASFTGKDRATGTRVPIVHISTYLKFSETEILKFHVGVTFGLNGQPRHATIDLKNVETGGKVEVYHYSSAMRVPQPVNINWIAPIVQNFEAMVSSGEQFPIDKAQADYLVTLVYDRLIPKDSAIRMIGDY